MGAKKKKTFLLSNNRNGTMASQPLSSLLPNGQRFCNNA